MKHLRRFETLELFEAVKNNIAKPWVTLTLNPKKVHYMRRDSELIVPDNEIWYTSTNENIIEPSKWWEGGEIISNTYENGKGVMVFANNIINTEELFDFDSRQDNETQLVSVKLPNCVEVIGDFTFYDCTSLTSIEIPNSVTSIGNFAFNYCESLTSITIPNSIISIGEEAFDTCSSLTSIVIPNSVTTINSGAFTYCTNLTSITYDGTIEQWNAITKGMFWKNLVPKTCMVHCTDGSISI